jgi:hypothetical protein
MSVDISIGSIVSGKSGKPLKVLAINGDVLEVLSDAGSFKVRRSAILKVIPPPTADAPIPSVPRICIGAYLKRNQLKYRGKDYPAIQHCEIISRNGMDWLVKTPIGEIFNVSSHAIEVGDWEAEEITTDAEGDLWA